MSTFDAKPRRGALERVISRLSIGSTTATSGGGTVAPTLTAAEFAGMLARIDGASPVTIQVAERLAFAYLDYGSAVAELVELLDRWGRGRALIRHPTVSISGQLHHRLTAAIVARQVAGATVHDLRACLGVGHRRWTELSGIAQDLAAELAAADAALEQHLTEELRGRDPRWI